MYTVIGGDGKEYGPVSAETIQSWIASKRCDAGTLVRRGGEEWRPMGQLPELASLLGISGSGRLDTTRTSPLAIASVVCGLSSPLLIGTIAPVGLLLGILARKQIKHNSGKYKGLKLANIGIGVSATLSIMIPLAILAGLLVPAAFRAKEVAMSVQCQQNLKQLSTAVLLYAKDHHEQLPPVLTWCDAISNRVGHASAFVCPLDKGKDCSYALNKELDGKTLAEINPATVLLFESNDGWNGAGTAASLVSRGHRPNRRNARSAVRGEAIYHVAFADGTIAEIPESGLNALRWEP